MSRDKQIEEMAKAFCAVGIPCEECHLYKNRCHAKKYATRAYNAGYRKASEVAREIFEEFRNAMRTEIARNEALFAEDEDDFYEGRNDAFRTAINCLAELKKKYTEGNDG